MSETISDWSKPSTEITDVDVAFPARALNFMPTYEECVAAMNALPEPAREGWLKLQRKWFYEGLPETFGVHLREGIDGNTAIRHLKVVQGSYASAHEHKEAAFVTLCSLWFNNYTLTGEEWGFEE